MQTATKENLDSLEGETIFLGNRISS